MENERRHRERRRPLHFSFLPFPFSTFYFPFSNFLAKLRQEEE